jgi:CheY-like chemotaxis protein
MNQPPLNSTPELIDILLVDDDEGDVLLTRKALDRGKMLNNLHVARDGVEALEFLRKEGDFSDAVRPDLILLDLNMPRKDGRQTLAEIKSDPDLKGIPVVILTTSESNIDVAESYNLQASCFITKPVDLTQFTKVIESLKEFVKLCEAAKILLSTKIIRRSIRHSSSASYPNQITSEQNPQAIFSMSLLCSTFNASKCHH